MPQYHFVAAWYYLLTGNISYASVHAEKAVRLVVETGTPFPEILCRLVMAQVLNHEGKRQEAIEQLTITKKIIQKMGTLVLEYVSLLTEAQFAMEKGYEAKCLESLRKAIALGKEQGYFTIIFFWFPSVMARLCAKALENGIEVDYVKALIRKLNLFPHAPSLEIENWPYPLKIYTLGRFGLIKDGKPVRFSKKAQKKPLLLLKALIALGGKRVREDQLADILYPEAEGDAAHDAFKTTPSRLRNLIGIEEVVEFYEGRVTLSPNYCYVDAWAFQRILNKYETLLKANPSKDVSAEAVRLSEKAMNIYRGHFLSDEEEQPWTVSLREELKSKFIRFIVISGHYYEQEEQWEKAVDYYQKGLEADNLTEEFYQRLMTCYLRLGRRGEAISVYQRCYKTLSSVLGIEPSPETDAIYKRITGHISK